jgi:hypothetical protein
LLKEVLSWQHGTVNVEEAADGPRAGYVDYVLRVADEVIVVEAKKAGAAFPSPTRRKQLKLDGSVLGAGPIAEAIQQVKGYGESKDARVFAVTNGLCWCVFASRRDYVDAYALVLFPFDDASDAERLYNLLSVAMVERGSLRAITNALPHVENRLLSVVTDADARIDRNNIADHVSPALNSALYADALLRNPDALARCFVATEARTKFDSHLGMYIADIKSPLVTPAPRIRSGKTPGKLHEIVQSGTVDYAPPVTLIIGPVGAGKTTYLRHFESVSGAAVLAEVHAHWIYVDLAGLGQGGNPRNFIYGKLRDYLTSLHPDHRMDYKTLVEPAYADDIASLARGPLAPINSNKELFNAKVSEHIAKEFEAVEPYVNRLLRYLAEIQLCLVVLDNVDLYEDDKLETAVFSEGLALSKNAHVNVMVSIRDTTFVRHKADPTFDAYELRKLWLDPPPLKAVISARLSYSKKILEGKHARVELPNGMFLDVPDLSVFFEIVQRSILQGYAGDHVAEFADSNIRKGLELVTNFIRSGHIQADRALSNYMKGNTSVYFPVQEIFKGMMLHQWKHYKEGRAECINMFDARLGAKTLQLLRLQLAAILYDRARSEGTIETPVSECASQLVVVGATEGHVLTCLKGLVASRLARTVTAEPVGPNASVVLTQCGGYYYQYLCGTFPYVEACLLDTAIDDKEAWGELCSLTQQIELCSYIPERMDLRVNRIRIFLEFLCRMEDAALSRYPADSALRVMRRITEHVTEEAALAQSRAHKYYAGLGKP